jgi:hypothetical protein
MAKVMMIKSFTTVEDDELLHVVLEQLPHSRFSRSFPTPDSVGPSVSSTNQIL